MDQNASKLLVSESVLPSFDKAEPWIIRLDSIGQLDKHTCNMLPRLLSAFLYLCMQVFP